MAHWNPLDGCAERLVYRPAHFTAEVYSSRGTLVPPHDPNLPEMTLAW
jgi:hypothetical protein